MTLLSRFLAWLFPRPVYKQAPPMAHPEYLALHVSSASNSRSALR